MWQHVIGCSALVPSPVPSQIQVSYAEHWHSRPESSPQIVSNLTRFPSSHGLLSSSLATNLRYWLRSGYQGPFTLLTASFHVWILWILWSSPLFFFLAWCEELDPICLLSNEQSDKHNIGNIVRISKIVFYHLVLLICWHLQLINKWKMARTLKLTWSLWEAQDESNIFKWTFVCFAFVRHFVFNSLFSFQKAPMLWNKLAVIFYISGE